MELIAKYKTVERLTEGVYKEKGSKFIGLAVACYNEEQAKIFLENWKNEYHQARHLCYAYRFGVDKKKYRANDDGEPNNSAGAPILGQIESFDLTNVLIGVVRYYGGTKLGVGGLINAYRSAAKDAINNGKIVELEVFRWIKISFDYHDMPHIMNLIKKNDVEMSDKIFESECQVTLSLKLSQEEQVINELKAFHSTKIVDLGIY